ncbi:MAG: MaoC family dehydratase N-terminal domain-containing protein [Chloroflexi bacterium]|nr:MaoC family dehydratase N-terminal domain-containing protein [Chloroflexota bacterium]
MSQTTSDQRPATTPTTRPDEIYVGRDFGRHDKVITPELVEHYCGAVDDRNAIYTGASPFGGPVAPGLVLHSEVYEYRTPPKGGVPSWYLPNLYGNLHARQEWELYRAVMVADAISTRSFIADRYVKRGRDYVVNEILYFDAEGAVAARGRTHQSFLRETDNSGIVVDEKREKEPERKQKFQVDISTALEEIPSLEKQISLDMCWKFSGPNKNYHNDKEAAQAWGFPDIVVQGMMSTCFLNEMLTDRYGAGWLAGGKMDVRLVNIVWQSDRLTCRGFVREIEPEGPRRRAHLDVWVEKEDGTKVTVGTASAVVD